MAEVYKRVKGMKLTKVIALHEDVQRALKVEAAKGADKASAILAGHRHDGHAEIDLDVGRVDVYVVLNDDRGLGAAMSIEYGRRLRDDEGRVIGRSTPVWALHDAFGLHHE